MNAKIRDAQLQKVPYMLVVGDKEMGAGAVSVRTRQNEDRGSTPLAAFKQQALQLVDSKSQEL